MRARRPALVASTALLALGLLAAPTAATASPPPAAPVAPTVTSGPTDVTSYQQDARHDGASTGAVRTTARVAWSRALGTAVSYPVVGGTTVFVSVRGSGAYGTDVYALDKATGATVWGPVHVPGTYYFSGLAYAGGRLFVVNFDGILQALDAAHGTPLWSVRLPGQWAFDAAPTVAGGHVYVVGAGLGGTLYAVRQSSGVIDWTQSVVNGDRAAPVVASGSVYTSFACEYTQAFTTAGAPRWSSTFGCEGGGGYTPALSGDSLWVRSPGTMPGRVLSTTDGTVRFTYDATYTPAVAGRRAVTVAADGIHALNASTGRQLWVQAGDGSLSTPAVVAGGIAYVGSSTGTVFGYDVATGRQMWSGQAGQPVGVDDWSETVRTGLAVSGDTLLVPASGTLVAFR